MALAAYTAGNSLREIAENCAAKASRPDIIIDPATKLPPVDGSIKNALAYRWLLDIIRNLYLNWDWPFAIVARTLEQATDQCLYLPDDFWRVAFTSPLYGLMSEASGNPDRFQINHVTRPDFFNNPDLAKSSRRGKPDEFYVARPDGLIYLNPPPDKTYAYELHYFRLIEELTSINEIPQFPHRDYLQQALLCEVYDYADDSRLIAAVSMRNQIWMTIRGSAYDMREEGMQTDVPMLDPKYFRNVNFED
jgi:hypothetical protein